MGEPLLEARSVTCSKADNQPIFSNVNFTVNEGDIVVLQGKSGSGKTTLLKCIAHLNVYTGDIFYHGRTPTSYGVPSYRTRVQYVPQRPSLLPGTPRDFLHTISTFHSRKSNSKSKTGDRAPHIDLQHPVDVAKAWGIEEQLWDREWSNLSGGESQRIAMAVGVGLDAAEVLLLDEPTSALDPVSSSLVEKYVESELRSSESTLKAIIWITHSEEQGRRVGTRFLHVSAGGIDEEAPAPQV